MTTLQRLQRSTLDEVLRIDVIADRHLAVLRWLVWLPLLSREELERVVRVNDNEQRDAQTLWQYLNRLAMLKLVDHVALSERGWPRDHYRYHATDLGLYTLAALNPQPISVYKLAMSYPVMQHDLFARLARPHVHLALSALVTRLIADAPAGHRVSSYQQPYRERYTDLRGKKHTFLFDAALLIQSPQGTQHAFYVLVDQPEHMLFHREAMAFVQKLLELRQATHFQHEHMPHVLLLSSQERFSFWAEHLNEKTLAQGIALLDVEKPEEVARKQMDVSCTIADLAALSQGAYAPIWTPFHTLIGQGGTTSAQTQIGIASLLSRVASPGLTERFSRAFSFQQVLLRRESGALSTRKNTLTCYVKSTPRADAAPFRKQATQETSTPQEEGGTSTRALAERILEGLYAGPEERHQVSALLTLSLSEQQKELLSHLAHHPFLERSDLCVLLRHQDERLIMRQIQPLMQLRLVDLYHWRGADLSWRERERYYLCEAALRFLAERHGLSPAYYLEPSYADKRKRNMPPDDAKEEESGRRKPISTFSREVKWVQRGAWGLCGKDGKYLYHTSGLYRCVRNILTVSYDSADTYQVRYWKSARESQRMFFNPLLDGERDQIRPDAELLYTTPASVVPRSVLLEYDRGTTGLAQLRDKYGFTPTTAWLTIMAEREATTMEVRRDVHDAFNAEVDEANALMAWGAPGVTSWYKNSAGRVTQNWPFPLVDYWKATLKPDPADFILRKKRAQAAAE